MRFRALIPTSALSLWLAACSTLGNGDTGLQEELAASRAETQAEHDRVEALERRLTELERISQTQVRDRRIEARLERLIDQNETILARAQTAGNCSNAPAQSSVQPPPRTGTASFDDASEDDQRKQLDERLRAFSRGRNGGLSVEQRDALRLLLRKDRVLDSSDPWHDY